MTIVCIDRPFSHHGGHSGYKMLAKFLDAEVVTNLSKSSWLLDNLPEKLLINYLQLHPNWYSKDALLVEWNLSKRLLLHSHCIYHFLYGENSCRHIGKVNVITGKKNAIVATYHQIPTFFEERRKQFSFLQDLDAVVLVSTDQRPFFESVVNPSKVHIIPHGVDVDFFCPSQRSMQPRRRFRCLTVGSNYRDSYLHLEVIRKLNTTSHAGKIEFHIVGEARSASIFSGIDNVLYRSSISDGELLMAYQEADMLLMPLQYTTANNAVLEAMACGLSIVVSDVGGIRDYVDESFGAIVPPHDLDAMVSEVSRLLLNSDKRIKMGRMARQKAKESFNWNVIAERMKSLYGSLAL